MDERSRTWELVRPEAAAPPAAAASTASLDGRHRAADKWSDKNTVTPAVAGAGSGPVAGPVAVPRAVAGIVTAAGAATTDSAATGIDPRPARTAERPVPTPRPTVDAASRRPVPPSAASKPPPVAVTLAPTGPVAVTLAPTGPVAVTLAPTGPVAVTLAPTGPVAVTLALTGPVAVTLAPPGPVAAVAAATEPVMTDGRTDPSAAGERGGEVGQRRPSAGGAGSTEQAGGAEMAPDSAAGDVTRTVDERGQLESMRPLEEKPRRPAPRRADGNSVANTSLSRSAAVEPSHSAVSGRIAIENVNAAAQRRVAGDSVDDTRRVGGSSAEGAGPRRVSVENIGSRRVPVDNVETAAPRCLAVDNAAGSGPRRPAAEHGRFKQEVLKLISRSRKEERRASDDAASRSRPAADRRDRSSPKQQDVRPAPPVTAQQRPTTLERERLTGSSAETAPAAAGTGPPSGVLVKSASADLARAGPIELEVATERAERGPRPDILPSPDDTGSPPSFHRQSSYDRSLQSFSTFSNLRSARIDLAGHNASFKRTAERLRRPTEPEPESERPRRPTAARQVEPPRVDRPPRPPVPPKTLQLRLQPAGEGPPSAPTTPEDADWSDSEPAASESESGSWERLDQMKAALCFSNPLLPRSGLSRSADHLPVPLPRTRLTEVRFCSQTKGPSRFVMSLRHREIPCMLTNFLLILNSFI